MNKNVVRIIISQVVYAILLMEIRYAMIGFRNVEFRMVLQDLLFVVPATISIMAMTVLGYTGVASLVQEFKIWKRKIEAEKSKEENKNNKKEVEVNERA